MSIHRLFSNATNKYSEFEMYFQIEVVYFLFLLLITYINVTLFSMLWLPEGNRFDNLFANKFIQHHNIKKSNSNYFQKYTNHVGKFIKVKFFTNKLI